MLYRNMKKIMKMLKKKYFDDVITLLLYRMDMKVRAIFRRFVTTPNTHKSSTRAFVDPKIKWFVNPNICYFNLSVIFCFDCLITI